MVAQDFRLGSENWALDAIQRLCTSGDTEANGSELDKIIQVFLKHEGYGRLAETIANLKTWRA